jgi:hypothetical protein
MDDSKNDGDVDDVDDDIERRQRRRNRGVGFLSQNFVMEYFTTDGGGRQRHRWRASLLPPSSPSS